MSDSHLSFSLKPIGFFHSSKTQPVEAARQASIDLSSSLGVIQLLKGQNFEQALEDLEGFTHLWVIYGFHLNSQWKPKVDPPRGPGHKVGVFASRSPYRPNPLGLSALKIQKIDGLKIEVESHDILDGSPIYDLKPYLPYSDSFPEAGGGWTEGLSHDLYEITISPLADEQLKFLENEAGLTEFRNVLEQQLQFDPLDRQKKRVKITETGGVLAYKTWRARFELSADRRALHVTEIFSGYNQSELESELDRWADKAIHRRFLTTKFSQGSLA
jgi:tRNA-Thr(GGU) m(6)t(6)A37 methyltransferase TsaA